MKPAYQGVNTDGRCVLIGPPECYVAETKVGRTFPGGDGRSGGKSQLEEDSGLGDRILSQPLPSMPCSFPATMQQAGLLHHGLPP